MRLVSLTFCGNMVGSVIFILLGIFDDFCKVFHAMFQFHSALFGRFSDFGFYSNLMLQIGERTNFIIALCSKLQILDSCPLLESGTVLEFFIRGINEPAGRVVFFGITDFRARFISMRSQIRSFVYSLPSDFILPRTKRSLSRGRKEMYLAALSSKDSPLISYPLALIKSKKSSYVEADLMQKLMSLLSWVFQVEPFCSDCHSLYFLPRSPPGMMMERLCSLHSSSLSFRMW